MQEAFFTSKQAAEITGCTLRQLQYWREKEVVVPTISDTGTGRSVYYSRSEVMELAVMEYCLGVGLNFEVAAATVKRLKDEGLFKSSDEKVPQRFMLWWDGKKRKLELVRFDLEKAIASLNQGRPVIPIWLDVIYQQLVKKIQK
ncbi:MAG: MerR family transcriptional regulator [Cyanomargarita calcarea GSE-NOS-MK-12-04C]|jgi:DNA-binding transcriptional MerR regulator|uniref:MerR family transcriptional regulator n=1 Tax=Cyanomargarita calcarea GSE-NOS-MK-12-04C TaxID=2839659 RepID=A0A951UTJ0_9CYAN|nr:MerR family transcriptional regulator [Cyanomargarita calcarea GSE-NOS-MK-12-04C]